MQIGYNIAALHPPPQFNNLPLKNDGWKTIVSFRGGIFSEAFAVKLPGSTTYCGETKPILSL